MTECVAAGVFGGDSSCLGRPGSRSMNVDAQQVFFFFSLFIQWRGVVLPTFRVSPPSVNLEIPSQTWPIVCLLGDSKSNQGDSDWPSRDESLILKPLMGVPHGNVGEQVKQNYLPQDQ